MFKLISRDTRFRVVNRYNALGGTLPCVVGVSECGRYQTVARVVDVVWLE